MQPEEIRAILTVSLLAAFADGGKDEREREQIRRIADSLAPEAGVDLARLYQDVLLKRADLDKAIAALGDADHRQLAYEMAVCVCDADGAMSPAEHTFLDQLGEKLGLGRASARAVMDQADALARESVPAAASAAPLASAMSPAEMDKTILNAAILNGALELLPQSLASMAIIPLQMRLTYRIGKSYGFELDQGHIKDFLATLGVGLTSQYVEQFGRKLVGGLLRKVGGKLAGGIGSVATGAAFSFATTYALGHVAKRYYGAGRKLDTAMLKDAFQEMLGQGRQLQAQYRPQIEERARTLNTAQIIDLVRQN